MLCFSLIQGVPGLKKVEDPCYGQILFCFHRMMGIARSSVVCFVIDTTGSMSDDIEEARSVAYEIIDSKRGTQDEPSEYILVPFNDPGMNHSSSLILLGNH